MAATLAVTPLAEGLQVLVVGDDLPLPNGRHQVRQLPDIGAAIVEAEALTAAVARAGAPSTFRLRSVAGHETWEPVIIVLTSPVTGDEAADRWRRWPALAGASWSSGSSCRTPVST